MEIATIVFPSLVKILIGAIVPFLAIFFACLTSIEEPRHSRLFATAIAISAIKESPNIAATMGIDLAAWTTLAATIVSYIALVPMLSFWVGMSVAKAFYVALLVALFVSVFSLLVMTGR